MKRILFTIAFLLIAGSAWGATYYVEKVADTTWRYAADEWPVAGSTACSANDIQGCLDDLDGGSHTVILHPGTYSGTDLDATKALQTNSTNTTLRGPVPGDDDYTNHASAVTIDLTGVNDDALNITQTGWIISNITITNVPTGKYGIFATATFTASAINITYCGRGIYLGPNSGGILTGIVIKECFDTDYQVAIATTVSPIVFNYCLFLDNMNPIQFISAATVTFNNCIFTGNDKSVLKSNSALAVVITCNNCAFVANGLNTTGSVPYIVITANAGTWTFNNSILADSSSTTFLADLGGATVSYNDCITDDYLPGFASNTGRESRVAFFIDDTENLNHWYDVADLAETYGYVTGTAMYQYESDGVDWEKLAGYINAGHEVASHGWGATVLSNMDAITLTHATATATVSIDQSDPDSDNWTGTLSLSTGQSINLHDAAYDTVEELIAYLDGLDGYTAAMPSGQYANGAKSVCLADIADQSLAGGHVFQFDQAELLHVELTESKAYLESKIQPYIPSWECKSFIYSTGAYDAAVQSYVMDTAGYSQARTGNGRAHIASLNQSAVPSVYTKGALVAERTAATIKRDIQGICDSALRVGAVLLFHGHSAGEISLANWGHIFDAIEGIGMTVATFSDAMDWVRANDDHVTDYVSYACSTETLSCLPDNSSFQLSPTSQLINAGTKAGTVSLTGNQTDYFGNEYFFTPYDTLNIGADQSYSRAAKRPTHGGVIMGGRW